LLAKAVVPVAVLFILAACGGSPKPEPALTQGVRGAGFVVQVPQSWRVTRPANGVVARRGDFLVSVTTFPLQKTYEPGRFAAVARELDGVAAKLAAQAGGKVTERVTTTVDGRKIRAYRYTGGPTETHIGFVLDGKREYQLLCQMPVGGSDPDDACALLVDSFSVAWPPGAR
jgi:hypothetical protein